LLATFKYFHFFSGSLESVLNLVGIEYFSPEFEVLLPVGISFYTFQTLSYSIDVYRGVFKPEKHLGIFALYVAFWPQLVAGPIERPSRLLPQFRERFDFDYVRARDGLLRMLWGFFKKLVIADRLAVYVSAVYDNPGEYTGLSIAVATFFFAFQIYCDFSGYSDIAIGSAQVMGIDLMENFKRPYFSANISEFWRRWHISLSTWFRDYVYFPLGGNRVSQKLHYFNLMTTFVLSGLWHGANWTFVVWGALHGLYMILTMGWQEVRQRIGLNGREGSRIGKMGAVVSTFLAVLLGWIFFRAATVREAFLLISQLFKIPGNLGSLMGLNITDFLVSVLLIALLLLQEAIVKDRTLDQIMPQQPKALRWVYYTIILLGILWFGVFTKNDFIYFQF